MFLSRRLRIVLSSPLSTSPLDFVHQYGISIQHGSFAKPSMALNRRRRTAHGHVGTKVQDAERRLLRKLQFLTPLSPEGQAPQVVHQLIHIARVRRPVTG